MPLALHRLYVRVAAASMTLLATAAPLLAAPAEGGDHGGEAAGKSGGLFASDPWPYIFNLAMFLILFGILAKFVWPRILEGLQAREAKQREDLTKAERAAAEAQKALEENKDQLAEARKEAQSIVDHARAESEKLGARLRQQAEADVQQMKDRAMQEIRSAQEQALSEIYGQAAAISTQIAGRILRREINADDQRQLVDDSLRQLTEAKNN